MENQPILIVEDDQALRILLTALFSHSGLTSDVVSNGEHAIECIRRKRYSAVLLDLMLPGTNGFEVLQFVRAEKPSLMPHIIVMTGASNQTLRHFDDCSIGALLHKPFDVHELLDVIGRVSRRGWLEAPAAGMTPRISSYRVH
jgi:two-component system response regulator (stage 0 sporulation protein F)